MNARKASWVACAGLVWAGTAWSQEAGELAAAADAVRGGLVRVEWTVQYDKGEPPRGFGWDSPEQAVREERPVITAGFLVAADRVVTRDPVIHPRFVRGVAIRFGGGVVEAKPWEAKPWAWAEDRGAVVLALAGTPPGAKPLAFDADAAGPYLAATYQESDGVWSIGVQPLGEQAFFGEDLRRFRTAPEASVIVGKGGVPAGLCIDGELRIGGGWRGSPLGWPLVMAEAREALLEATSARATAGIVRVSLQFRSPRARSGSGFAFSSGDEEEGDSERHVAGVVLAERRVLVLAPLKAGVTGRLERILIHPPEGEPVGAAFAHTLADWGAMVVTPERPLKGALEPAASLAATMCHRLLPSVEVIIHGEQRVAYAGHARLTSLATGWRGRVFPALTGEDANTWLFNAEGRLVALPVVRRQRAEELSEHWYASEPSLTPAAYVLEAVAGLPGTADASNVPLSEEEENRLAWMGVELQGMNRDLARAKGVAELTRGGQTGAIVAYVHPGSPAEKGGVEAGEVLLRLHVEGFPRPIDVQIGDDRFGGQGFPWEQLDQVDEQFLEHIPAPWTPAENPLTRALTDIGFGRKYRAEFFREGQVLFRDFVIEQGPPHYDSARRFEAEAVGVTVRDVTYEVRRHMQMEADASGVIVSKIEPGSKAAVSGLKPYEIVTAVNDVPVKTAEEFGKATEGKDALRLSVKRMTKQRIVTIRMGNGG